METLFKNSALTAAILSALVISPAMANDSGFLDGASLSINGVSDTRYRSHKYGLNAEHEESLNYSDYNLILNFSSGYHEDTIGIDLAGYFSGSLYNNGECSEISICDKWKQDESQNGTLKVTKAAVKFKSGSLSGDIGLTQMGVGTIGNVWSFAPGTYKGGKAFIDLGDFTLGYGAATAYTAPWWMTTKHEPVLKKPNDSHFDFLHSIGFVGQTGNVGLNFGIGSANLSSSDETNSSFKAQVDVAFGDIDFSYDFYGVNSEVDYDGLGAHHGLSLKVPAGGINWLSELRYTHTENEAEFAPRTVAAYGSNNGTWSQWWDALSDWNQNTQLAWYNRISRDFGNGWNLYAGAAISQMDGDKSAGFDSEYAVNSTIAYTMPSGALKGSTVSFHSTYLVRDMNDNSDHERADFRLQVSVPYNFL